MLQSVVTSCCALRGCCFRLSLFPSAATPVMQVVGHSPSSSGASLVAPSSAPARWRRPLIVAVTITLVALCGCALLSRRQSASGLLILGENPVFEPFTGFSTAGMASENPNTGATFAHLIQMAYECTEELKRSLRGLADRDYDAEVRVSFIETLILKLVDRLGDDEGRDDVPDFQHLPRGASYKAAVHKIAVFARLVKMLPNEDWFQTNNMRAVQYGEIRYDLRMIAQALRREVKSLSRRHFSGQEPAIPHYISNQRTIENTVGVLASQHPAEWAQLGVDFQKQLDFGMPLRASQEPSALGAAQPATLSVVRPLAIQRVYRPVSSVPSYNIRKAVTNKVLDANNMILKTKKNMRILVGNQYEIDVPSSATKAHMLSLHNGEKVTKQAAKPTSLEEVPNNSGELLFYGHQTRAGELSGEAMPMDELKDVDRASPEHVELVPVSDVKTSSVL